VSEKTQKATPHKLREALKRGEVTKSRELTSLASYIATVTLLWTAAEPFGKRLMSVVERAVVAPGLRFEANGATLVIEAQAMIRDAAWIVLPLLLIGIAAAAIVGGLQAKGVFSFEPIMPKFEHIDPAKGLKNLFSTRQVFELAKTLLKTALLTAALAWVIAASLDFMLKMVYTPAADLLRTGGSVIFMLLRWAAVIYAICAGLDYAHQYYEFMKQQRMSIEDVRRELRDDEGDPLIRSQRRSSARQIVYSPAQDQKGGADKNQSGS